MKKALVTGIVAFLAGKAGCGCMVIAWALLFFLVVVPILAILMALGVPWESVSWVMHIMLTIEILLIVGSVFF